jgi:hypothetical protein
MSPQDLCRVVFNIVPLKGDNGIVDSHDFFVQSYGIHEHDLRITEKMHGLSSNMDCFSVHGSPPFAVYPARGITTRLLPKQPRSFCLHLADNNDGSSRTVGYCS